MEFIINKIDTDVRQKLQEETKNDKVHSGKGITVNRDLKDKEREAYLKVPPKDSKNKRYWRKNSSWSRKNWKYRWS